MAGAYTAFNIAEKYVPKETLIRIARAALLAQDIKEGSWDEAKERYKITDAEAATEAARHFELEDFWYGPIIDWTMFDWNEVQDWAKDVLKK